MRIAAKPNGRNIEIKKESFVLTVEVMNIIGNPIKSVTNADNANTAKVFAATQ